MAVSAVESLCSLHELLRRPPMAAVSAATTNLLVASCQDAYLPVYTFPARPMKTATHKLPRIDSMPVVPDYAATRCDSPPMLCAHSSPPALGHASDPSLSPTPNLELGLGFRAASLTSFNDLPISLTAAAAVPDVDDADGDFMMYDKPDGAAVQVFASRPMLRRHPSDVMLSCGNGVCTVASAAAATSASAEVPSRGLLEVALMALWEARADRGMFRYDVSQCPTRVLPGRRGFVAQLNEGRATKKRPTEFAMDRVMQPFDPAKFHFKKAAVAEALVAFQPATAPYSAAAAAATQPCILPPTAPLGGSNSTTKPGCDSSSSGSSSPNLVLINVSPIDYGHVLLVPNVLDQLPQALDCRTVLLALQFARELGNPHFRVGYNSLGAFATINHLHFHSYYLPLSLPCENAETEPLPGALARPFLTSPASASAFATPVSLPCKRRFEGDDDACLVNAGAASVFVSRLVNYPVNAFVVESCTSSNAADCVHALEALASAVGIAAERMQAANQPFNILVSDAGRRVFVFPQCFAERQAAGVVPGELLDTGVNPAAFEIAGHLVLKRGEDFAGASEGWAERLLAAVSLPEERFMEVAGMCFGSGC